MGASHSGIIENFTPLTRVPQSLPDARPEGRTQLSGSKLSFHGKYSTGINTCSALNSNNNINNYAPHNLSANPKSVDVSSETLLLLNQLSLDWVVFDNKFNAISELFVERLLTNNIVTNATSTPQPPPSRSIAQGGSGLSHAEGRVSVDMCSVCGSGHGPTHYATGRSLVPSSEEKGLSNRDSASSTQTLPALGQQRGRNNLLPSLQQEKPFLGIKKAVPSCSSSGAPTKDADPSGSRQRVTREASAKTSSPWPEPPFSDAGAFEWSSDETSMMHISPALRIAVLEMGYLGMRCVVDTLAYLASGECRSESVIRPPVEGAPFCTRSSSQATNCSVAPRFHADSPSVLSENYPTTKGIPRSKADMINSVQSPRRCWLNSTESSPANVAGNFVKHPALKTSIFMNRGDSGGATPHLKCTNSNLDAGLGISAFEQPLFFRAQQPLYRFLSKSHRERGYNSELLEFINALTNKIPKGLVVNQAAQYREGPYFRFPNSPNVRAEGDISQRCHHQQNIPSSPRTTRSHAAVANAPTTTPEIFRTGEAGSSRAPVDATGGGGRKIGNGDAAQLIKGCYDHTVEQDSGSSSWHRDALLEALCEVFAHLHLTEGDLAVLIMHLILSIIDVQEDEREEQHRKPFLPHSAGSDNVPGFGSSPRLDLEPSSCVSSAGRLPLGDHKKRSQIVSSEAKKGDSLGSSNSCDRLPNSSIWIIVLQLVRTYFTPPLLQARRMLQFASGCIAGSSSGLVMDVASRRDSGAEGSNFLHSHVEDSLCAQKSSGNTAVRSRSKLNASSSSGRSQVKLTNSINTLNMSAAMVKRSDSFLNYHVSTNYDILCSQSHVFFRKYSALFNLPAAPNPASQNELDRKVSLSSCSLSYSNSQPASQLRPTKPIRASNLKMKTKIMANTENAMLISSTPSSLNENLNFHAVHHGGHLSPLASPIPSSPKKLMTPNTSPQSNFRAVKHRLSELLVQKRSFVLHFTEYVGKGRRRASTAHYDLGVNSVHRCDSIDTKQVAPVPSTDLVQSPPPPFASYGNIVHLQDSGSEPVPHSLSTGLPAIDSDVKGGPTRPLPRPPPPPPPPCNPLSKDAEEAGLNDILFPLRTRMLVLCRQYVYLYDAVPSTLGVLGMEPAPAAPLSPAYLSTPIALLDTARTAMSDFCIISGPTDTETAMVHASRQVRGALPPPLATTTGGGGGMESGPGTGTGAETGIGIGIGIGTGGGGRSYSGDPGPDGELNLLATPLARPFPGSNPIDVDVFRVRNGEGELCLLTLPIVPPPFGGEGGHLGGVSEHAWGATAARSPCEMKMRLPGVDSTLYARKGEPFLIKRPTTGGGGERQHPQLGHHDGITVVPGTESVAITVYPLRILYKGVLHHFLFQKLGARAWWYMRLTELVAVCQSTAHALEVAVAKQSVQAFIRNRVSYPVGPSAFECIDMLGVGAFGRVLLVRHKLNMKLFAMKIVRKTCFHGVRNVIEIRRECAILESLDCPYIMKIHACFQSDSRVYILLDYLPGCELLVHTQRAPGHRFDEVTARFYIAELAIAVEHLRLHGIVHRDIKGDNLVLDVEGHVVLTDFGFAKKITVEDDLRTAQGGRAPGRVIKQQTGCGTRAYIAPEVLNAVLPNREGYGLEADWWSMGVVLFTLITGCFPFLRKTEQETNIAITQSPLQFPPHVALTEAAQDVLLKLMQKNPEKRITTLSQLKRHSFFDRFDWEACERRQLRPPISLHKDSYNTPSSSSAATRRLKEAVMSALRYSKEGQLQDLPVCWDTGCHTPINTRYVNEFNQEKEELQLLESAFGSDTIPSPIQVENDVFSPLYDNQELFSSMRDVADSKYDLSNSNYIPEVPHGEVILCRSSELLLCSNCDTGNTAGNSTRPLGTDHPHASKNNTVNPQQQCRQSMEGAHRLSLQISNPLTISDEDVDDKALANEETFGFVLDDYKEENYAPMSYAPMVEAHTVS